MKALIFDFDGVLVLSEKPRFKVIQQSAAAHNVDIADESIKTMVGRTTVAFLSDVVPPEQEQEIGKIIADYEREYKGNITKYVEPIDLTVNFIRGYEGELELALASMSSRKVIEELTQHFNIFSKFKVIVSKEDVKNHKPDPEIYLDVAKRLNVLPDECVVIEDTVVGVQAAINANMHCFVLLNGFNDKQDFENIKVDGFIESEEDLLKAVLST